MTMRKIVVVGNGIAGLTACDSLRSAGFDGELTVVGAERHQPYSRPALSKALLHAVDDNMPTGTATADSNPMCCPSRPTKRRSCSESAPRAWTSTPGWCAWTGEGSCRMTASSSPRVPGQSDSGRVRRRRRRGQPDRNGTARTGNSPCARSRMRSPQGSASLAPVGHRDRRRTARHGGRVRLPARGLRGHPRLRRQAPGAPAGRPSGRISSPPPPSGADCAWSAAGRPGLSITVPGRGSSWPTAPQLEADLVVTAIGDEPNIGWLAGSNLLVDGRCGWIPAAGSGRRSSPPATWRPSRRAAGCNACPCGPAPSTRPRSPASACSKVMRRPSSTSSRISGRRASACHSSRSASRPLVGASRLLRAGRGPGVDAPALGEHGRLRNRRGGQLPDPHPETAPVGRRGPGHSAGRP